MKKIITTIFLLTSVLSLANAKEDIKKANELLAQNKIEETVKVLKNIKYDKNEKEEFEKVNYALFQLSNNDADRIKYLEKTASDKKSKGVYAMAANYILAATEKDVNKKIKLFNELNARDDYNTLPFAVEHAKLLYANNMLKEAYSINAKIDKKDLKVKKEYYISLFSHLYQMKKDTEATKLVNKALKLDPKDKRYNAYVYVIVASWQNNYESTKKYLQVSYSIDPRLDTAIEIFVQAIYNKDEALENKFKDILLNSKDGDSEISYTSIASYLYKLDSKLIDKAIEYAREGVKNRDKYCGKVYNDLKEIKKSMKK